MLHRVLSMRLADGSPSANRRKEDERRIRFNRHVCCTCTATALSNIASLDLPDSSAAGSAGNNSSWYHTATIEYRGMHGYWQGPTTILGARIIPTVALPDPLADD